MTPCDTRPIVDWLVDGARSAADTEGVLAELCERLAGCGMPLSRAALFVHTLHPQVMGIRFLWKPGEAVEVDRAPFEAFEAEDFRHSPVRHVIDTGVALRRRLADASCRLDSAVVRDLRAAGATDYLAVPLRFADGTVRCATFTTEAPGGFRDAQVAGLQAIVAPLARVVENQTLRYTASTLLDTYVGAHAGQRVFAGQIRRGQTTTIDAAIWLSDMRHFTRFADRLPPQALIDLLNRYFDCQVPGIVGRGGEVLKFVGDGLLAIFAIAPGGDDVREVCGAALDAAHEARRAVLAAFGDAPALVEEGPRFGLALHLGQVLYGNIGSGNRLDFTCIGPAVNLAARLEKLSGGLGRTIVASEEFARHLPASRLVRVGDFALPGFAAPRAVFGLDDE
ncbi:MAG: adenylate/guanylate cyclase domain-containing protein [bacterium]|nr:adenylate/guanylate cyclase domain-containing protein [bacterium]